MMENPQELNGAIIEKITSWTGDHIIDGKNGVFKLVIKTNRGILIYKGCHSGHPNSIPFIEIEETKND